MEAVSPDEVGYLACLSGREEAGATLLGKEPDDGAKPSDAGLEAGRLSYPMRLPIQLVDWEPRGRRNTIEGGQEDR